MQLLQSLPWVEPLEFAAGIQLDPAWTGSDWIFLYSGIRTSYSGRYSYLACHPLEQLKGNDFIEIASKTSQNRPCFDNAWFGYLGYGLKNSLETLKIDNPNWFTLPNLTMTRFGTIFKFDHDNKTIDLWSEIYPIPVLGIMGTNTAKSLPDVVSITSNMTKELYLDKVTTLIGRIHNGELYQANLTRKFYGEFRHTADPYDLFRSLCTISPATYSAFLKLGDTYIVSSSPEQFMAINAQGGMQTRPIKGTAPRYSDPMRDEESRQNLAKSEKDRAENLMIVDLMRNDFSRSCIPGSVVMQSLFDITSHATIHHLSSTIIGKKRTNCSTIDAISNAFPPGSMTGAPKIRAMNICSELEQIERGIYSGAIGWLGGDGSCELSVVIRTLIIQGKHFEFQVGGGIVADSVPEQEWLETIHKSKGILLALGLTNSNLYI